MLRVGEFYFYIDRKQHYHACWSAEPATFQNIKHVRHSLKLAGTWSIYDISLAMKLLAQAVHILILLQ